jgi:histidinol dehydrogenase
VRGGALAEVLPRVAEIISDVRERGDAAVLDWSERLDGARPDRLRVSVEALAGAELDERSLAAVRALASAVESVHAAQVPQPATIETAPGLRVERRFVPLESVGIYVPGGRAPLASSLVMAAVPARVAGVCRIAVATPRPARAVLATAREL